MRYKCKKFADRRFLLMGEGILYISWVGGGRGSNRDNLSRFGKFQPVTICNRLKCFVTEFSK